MTLMLQYNYESFECQIRTFENPEHFLLKFADKTLALKMFILYFILFFYVIKIILSTYCYVLNNSWTIGIMKIILMDSE